jgi:hypothetical protein
MLDFKYHKKRYVLGISLIVLIVFFVLFKQGVFENKALKMAKYWDQQGRIRTSDSSKKAVTITKVNDEITLDPAVKLEEKKLPDGDSGNMYYIIIGSYTNLENAKIVAQQYQSQGYNTAIIRTTSHNGNKTALVSVNALSNRNEAVSFLRELQSKVDGSAWIYSQTKNNSLEK